MSSILDGVVAKVVLGIIRHVVAGWGASLVTQGLASQDQVNQIVGAIMVIVPIGFSIYDKMQAQSAAKAAVLKGAQK